MRCPTCSSPLPDGAMFCGQCGRAITAADWAAFRAVAPVEQAPVAEPPRRPWVLQEPQATAVPAGTPWWLDSERGGGAPKDGVPDDSGPEGGAPEDSESGDDETPRRPDENGSRIPQGHRNNEPLAGEARADRPRAAASASAERSDTGAVRPASVPLWTASVTPITVDPAIKADARPTPTRQDSIDEADVDGSLPAAAHTDDAPAVVDDAASVQSPADDAQVEVADVAPAVAVEPVLEDESSDPEPLAAPPGVDVAAVEGDTNVIAPLVAPTTARESAGAVCSDCGAPLHQGDIFCGECGAVVQSVAASFTGPIVPITGTAAAPSSGRTPSERPLPEGAQPGRPQPGETHEAPPAPRSAPLTPTPLPSPVEVSPPFVPDPVPAPKRRRLFGRRQPSEAPQLWSSSSPAATTQPTSDPSAPTAAPVEPIRHAGTPTHSAPTAARHTPPASSPEVPPVRVGDVPEALVDRPVSPPQPPVRAAEPEAPAASRPAESAVPTVAPAPQPSPSAAPWAVTLGAPADDVESTRIVPRREVGESFILQFSTGESFTVQGSGLVGRAPTPQPGEAIELLVRILDPGRSVSKTHLEFGQDDGHLWVADRWSGNGTIVKAPSQGVRRAEPGKRVRVPRGTRVEIGEQFFIVS
ncbi:zinc-ribbon domain-containing protein [Frondihabitans sp. 4ASC-45]|uniref:zinc-ribbon domain-containing protein n=1 Tax=Frondihabitans sp. 4ASC-45 TaxID=3111636 RepID=UPI003C28EB5E